MLKSCFVVLNKVTGSPVAPPNREGKVGLFNPGAITFAVGSVAPEPKKRDPKPEACVYRPDSDGNLALTSQFPLNGRNPFYDNQWPVNNWATALLSSNHPDGVYKTHLPYLKSLNFNKIEPETINKSLTQCEYDIHPQMGWLHMTEDKQEGGKTVQMKAERFAALLRSRLFELGEPIRRSKNPKLMEQEANLKTAFYNMLINLREGVNDQVCTAYTVQFSEAVESIGIQNHEGLLTCLHLLNGSKEEDVILDLLPGAFGKKPETKNWITPVISSSPLWVWNKQSPLICENQGFDREFAQQKMDALFK